MKKIDSDLWILNVKMESEMSEAEEYEYLFNYLGDREVFFCEKKGDVFSGSIDVMMACFDILHYVDGICFWKLKKNPKGLCDVMGSFLDMDLKEDEVGVFETHHRMKELEDLEQWTTVSLDWFNQHKNSGQLRKKIKDINKHM